MIKKIIWLMPALVLTVIMFVLSNIRYPVLPDLNLSFTDKIAHFIEYFFYTIAVIIGFDSFDLQKRKLIKYTILWTAFWGISDEVHQYFVPGRDCNLYDWFADLAGIIAAVLLIKYILKIKNSINLKFSKNIINDNNF